MKFNEITESLKKIKILKSRNQRILAIKKCEVNVHRKVKISNTKQIECFHSRGRHLCKFIGTEESVCTRKEFSSQRTGLGHQHGRRFIILGHQNGRRDVM